MRISRRTSVAVTGHSLIELMMVLCIIALVIFSTLPSYKTMVERYRLNRSLEIWRNALELAKTAAYTARVKTFICPWQRQTHQCSRWDLPYDALKIASQASTTPQPPEKTLHIIELPTPRVNTRFTQLTPSQAIAFDVTGKSVKNLSIILQQHSLTRQLKLSRLGRIRIE